VRRALLLAPALLAVAFFALPLLALLLRAPWADLGAQIAAPEVRSALWLSLVGSVSATALSVGMGLPLAWWLARSASGARPLVRAIVALPMVLPPVVGGVGLLLAFGRRGLAGAWLDEALGLSLPFTTAGVVVAEVFVAMPFFVLAAEAGFRSMDRRYEEAAATLGAGGWTAFRRVTLPLIAPSIRAGTVVCWARALGEFGATITFAGNLPGRTQTIPLAVYLALETSPDGAIVLSLVLVAVSVLVLAGLRDRWFPA
jgi:molybdate transport system permease protein